MPKISQEKITKIKEAIISLLFEKFPHSLFTAEIARELARDEEFIKALLLELEKAAIVKRSSNFTRKIKWTLSEKAYFAYKKLSASS
ncbi:MAG: hypothetical protein QXJ92_01270 [Candidatus Pacearchaeota archaeon]